MSFRLVNVSATFQRYISQILASVLEKEVLVYLNNILIANQIKKDHQKKIKEVKRLFTEANLMIKEGKCEYFKEELKFLKFRLIRGEIDKDSHKMKAIQN